MTTPPSDPIQPQAEFQPRSNAPQEPETKLWEGGFSPKAMYGTWLLSAILTAGVLAALIILSVMKTIEGNEATVWTVGVVFIILWWIACIAIYLFYRLGTYYEVTTQRLIHTSGILVRTTDRIDVIDIDDVSFTQGVVQRILDVGTITLMSKDASHPMLVLRGIDKVDKVSGMIDDVRRKERRKRSLHIDAS
jgi:membrane protein YdbS with pleckstrin-like domain